MGNQSGKSKEESFEQSLIGKDIPVLTLDHKWYRLLDRVGKENVRSLEEELNELLKKQGRINSEIKELKKVKKKLMEEIVSLANESGASPAASQDEKIAQNKHLVEECNARIDTYNDENLELPGEINRINRKLMLLTMEHCYDTLQSNTDDINELEDWITKIRIELKKNLIRKQEMELKNHEIYSYMNDIFGLEVMDLFEIRFDPEKHNPTAFKDDTNKK